MDHFHPFSSSQSVGFTSDSQVSGEEAVAIYTTTVSWWNRLNVYRLFIVFSWLVFLLVYAAKKKKNTLNLKNCLHFPVALDTLEPII